MKSKRAKLSVISKLKRLQSDRQQRNEPEVVPCKSAVYSQDYNHCVATASNIEDASVHSGHFANVQCVNQQVPSVNSFCASASSSNDYFYDPRFPILSFLLNEPDGYLPPYMTRTAFPNIPQQMQGYYAGQIHPSYQSHLQW